MDIIVPSTLNKFNMSKKETLRKFIYKYDHLPAQGTSAWRENRKKFIGGSEISTILNKNKYKTLKKLILERLEVTKFEGNSATYWGNLFEPLINSYSESIFKCNILETGSIPYKESNLSYSPDGLSVINYKNINNVINIDEMKAFPRSNSLGRGKASSVATVLFEFKCPHSRIPSGIIPDYYITQPLTGMNVIDICDLSIFIEAIYRKCVFEDLIYNNNYISYGHYTKFRFEDFPLECGFITIFGPDIGKSHLVLELIKSDNIKKIKNIYDLSTCSNDIFDVVLQKSISGEFTIDYTYNYRYNADIFNSYDYIQKLYNEALYYKSLDALDKDFRDNIVIGVIPYKLLKIYINTVAKDENYIEKNDLINKSSKIINFVNLHKHKNVDELKKLVRKLNLY